MIHYDANTVPYLTTGEMREVDRLMIETYGIELLQMMEHAGRNLAQLARVRFLDGNPSGRRVIVLAGTGGNGGGALVAARWLHNAGASVQVLLSADPDRMTSVPRHQLNILHRMGVAVAHGTQSASDVGADLILDGLIGYSLKGAPHGTTADLIAWANNSPVPALALDVPSGLDSGAGIAYDPTVRAAATMTLALPKVGFRATEAIPFIGELYLANISVPRELYAEPSLGLHIPPIFQQDDIVHLQ
jgi:NAD(P)H-hydrate epimerase